MNPYTVAAVSDANLMQELEISLMHIAIKAETRKHKNGMAVKLIQTSDVILFCLYAIGYNPSTITTRQEI